MQIIKNSLSQSHQYVKMFVKEGDVVVDATAGNGNDTLLLAELVGKVGKVYSFDIQEKAVEKTKKKLLDKGLEEQVEVIRDGHQFVKNYVKEPIKAAMFNLGYLPGGDHRVCTHAESTIKALNHMMELLLDGGIITIVVYYGGDSGFEEKEIVMEFFKTIDQDRFMVMKTEFINQQNCPPILVCIEKIAK